MPNAWVLFVKEYAKKNNISYGCAISKAGEEYRALKSEKKIEPAKKIEMLKVEPEVKKIETTQEIPLTYDERVRRRFKITQASSLKDLKIRQEEDRQAELIKAKIQQEMKNISKKKAINKFKEYEKVQLKKIETPKPIVKVIEKVKIIKTPKIIQNAVISKKEKKAILAELSANLTALKKQQSRMPSQSRLMDISDLEKRILEVGSL